MAGYMQESIDGDIRYLGHGANGQVFIKNLYETDKTTEQPTEIDEKMFHKLSGLCRKFAPTFNLPDPSNPNALISVTNNSIVNISDMANLVTVTPISQYTEMALVNRSAKEYKSFAGVFAVKITSAVASGATGSIDLNAFIPFLKCSLYDFSILYSSTVLDANVSIALDVSNVTPEDGDTVVKTFIVSDDLDEKVPSSKLDIQRLVYTTLTNVEILGQQGPVGNETHIMLTVNRVLSGNR